MTRVDLHPDELLDPGRRRVLSPDDRSRLDMHLAHCPACAFEAAVAEDFALWLEHPLRGEEAVVARLVDAVVAGRSGVAAIRPRRTLPTRSAGRWSRRLLLVAAVIAVATGAGAAAWYFVLAPLVAPRHESLRPATSEPSGLNTSPVLPAPAATRPGDETHDRRAPAVPQAAEGNVAPVPEPSTPGASASLPLFVPQRTTGTASSTSPRPPPPAFPSVLPRPETSAQLFARANDLRRNGEYAQAARLYHELQASFPGSREETSSRVTLGRLLLDRLGDVAGALAQFDAYLASAPDATLAEEALVGRALALQRLGRTAEERAAWTALLARYPASANADRARGRLEELMHETR